MEAARELLGGPFNKSTYPIHRALLSSPNHLPKTPPNNITLKVRIQHMNLEGTQTQDTASTDPRYHGNILKSCLSFIRTGVRVVIGFIVEHVK